jgi:hypothetical protein
MHSLAHLHINVFISTKHAQHNYEKKRVVQGGEEWRGRKEGWMRGTNEQI